jgi:alpha-glucoside transport system substrate-binding protein
VDGDAFAFFLPAMPTSPTKPVVGGGEFVAAYADRPEVQAFQTYLTSAEWATAKVKLGAWVSANNGVPQSAYTDAISALSALILGDKETTFRFDASDMMPAAVGSGSEWKQMTAWFAEDKPTADVLAAIDATWPAS